MANNGKSDDELQSLIRELVSHQHRERLDQVQKREKGIRFLESSRALIRLFGTLCFAKSSYLDDAVVSEPGRRDAISSMSYYLSEDGEGKGADFWPSEEEIDEKFVEVSEDRDILRKTALRSLSNNLLQTLEVCKKYLFDAGEFLPTVRLNNYSDPEKVIRISYEPINVRRADQEKVEELERQRKQYPTEYSSVHYLIFNQLVRTLFEIFPFDTLKIQEGLISDEKEYRRFIAHFVDHEQVLELYRCIDHLPDIPEYNRLHRIAYHEQIAVAEYFGVLDIELSPASPLTSETPILMDVSVLKSRLGISKSAWDTLRNDAKISPRSGSNNKLSGCELRALLNVAKNRGPRYNYKRKAQLLFDELFPQG